MDTFEEWLQVSHPSLPPPYVQILTEKEDVTAGMLLSIPTEVLVEEFAAAGIPKLKSFEIVQGAKEHFGKISSRKSQPLGIFWDVESIRIPSEMSGREVHDKIMNALESMGKADPTAPLHAYFENSDTHMPVNKRRQLQQLGWKLIDTPHMRTKEVADKVILVDVLQFALKHHYQGQPCTVCLITKDSDFTYLLSQLKNYEYIHTAVISTGLLHDTSNLTVLGQTADSFIRWDYDVLRSPQNTSLQEETRTAIPVVATPIAAVTNATPTTQNVVATGDDDDDEDNVTIASVLNDDVHLLVDILKNNKNMLLKSLAGIKLRTRNPVAFGDKDSRTAVFNAALERGLVAEQGSGGTLILFLTRKGLAMNR